MNKFIITVSVLLLLFEAKSVAESQQASSLESLFANIDRKYSSMVASQELLEVPEFIQIYSDPSKYLKSGLGLITKGKMSSENVEIFIYGMQKLSLNEYLFFSQSSLRLWKDGKLSKQKFYLVVFPPYQWSVRFPENYNDRRVVEFLQRLKTESELKDKSQYIDTILSGQANEDVRELRSAQQLK